MLFRGPEGLRAINSSIRESELSLRTDKGRGEERETDGQRRHVPMPRLCYSRCIHHLHSPNSTPHFCPSMHRLHLH